MSLKMECPGCKTYGSDIRIAVDSGLPCPRCGLSAAASSEVLEARLRCANTDLTARYEAAVIRADRAEAEAAALRGKLDRVRGIVVGEENGQ